MNTDRLNRWLTLDANNGVLIGIILLIVELDQNRNMVRAQTRNAIAAEGLTPDERFQYGLRTVAWFRFFENVHYQYRQVKNEGVRSFLLACSATKTHSLR